MSIGTIISHFLRVINVQFLHYLGYPEAADLHLHRNETGIVSGGGIRYPALALVNYPTQVTFASKRVIKVIESLAHQVWIEVFANLKSGKKISLFTINPEFFKEEMTAPVVCLRGFFFNFKEDTHRTFNAQLVDTFIDGDDAVISFAGTLKTADSTHEFAYKFLAQKLPSQFHFRPAEAINLKIDVNGGWDLNLENNVWVK